MEKVECTTILDMTSNEGSVFEDIEQDNNPLLYGSKISALNGDGDINNPNSHGQVPRSKDNHQYSVQQDLMNQSLVLSGKISKMLESPGLKIKVIATERLANSSVVMYSIELTDEEGYRVVVKRRYSEFRSLRDNLVKLFPLQVVPPVPERHSLLMYLLSTVSSSKELCIIETRKRSFENFLEDLIFNSDKVLRESVLTHKFFDPNYEQCWNNALNEPPVNLIPDNLLLANPMDPIDQNGLYSLLPTMGGFDTNSKIDHMGSLRQMNQDLKKLNQRIHFFESAKGNEDDLLACSILHFSKRQFHEIPEDLIEFESAFHRNTKATGDARTVSTKMIHDIKSLINVLVEMGGNLNNFSLQVHELHNPSNSLSFLIEKFGSAIDSSFLSYESFQEKSLIPELQEPISQFSQYYTVTLQIVKFYKYKLMQYFVLYESKLSKYHKLLGTAKNLQAEYKLENLKNLGLESPTIQEAIKRLEYKQKRAKSRDLSSKNSWYDIFGGSSKKMSTLHGQSTLPDALEEDSKRRTSLTEEEELEGTQDKDNQEGSNRVGSSDPADSFNDRRSSLDQDPSKHKMGIIEKELEKLDQLIDLMNHDMFLISEQLKNNFDKFLRKMERSWIKILLYFVRGNKTLFTETLHNWTEFRNFAQTT